MFLNELKYFLEYPVDLTVLIIVFRFETIDVAKDLFVIKAF